MSIFLRNKLVLLSILTFLGFFISSLDVSADPPPISQNVSVAATVGTLPNPITGGGGYQSGVKFSGLAYPKATVTIQKGLTPVASVVADESGAFSIVTPENNWQLFTLFATDTSGRRSTVLNFPTVLYTGYLTDISGIRFAPTITTDKVSVKKGDYLTILGSALPNVPAEIVFEDGPESAKFTLSANSGGNYSLTAPINILEGEYVVRIHYIRDGRSSKVVRVIVGNVNILRSEVSTNIPGDCNFDQKVTLVDFSVLAYWYGKSNPPRCVDTNHDNVINLVDFSILAYYWSN